MSIGLNRENDTPIGGKPEYRGNFQTGEVFSVDDIPTFDGEKFVPGSNTGLAHGYGGLAIEGSIVYTADGSLIDNWTQVMPIAGTPLQTTPNATTGIITVDQTGTYIVNFTCNISALSNNADYIFVLFVAGGSTGFGTHVVGSNNLSSQTTSFSLQVDGAIGAQIAVSVDSIGNDNFTVISASLSVQRIG